MVRHTASLIRANEFRHREGAARTVQKAREAIPLIGARVPKTHRDESVKERHLEVLKLRVAHPSDSIAELAAHLGVAKDTYWSELRRALLHANRIQSTTNRKETHVRSA
jgi:DNA-binding transcriptional regulator WhiA